MCFDRYKIISFCKFLDASHFMKTEFTIVTWNIAGGRPIRSEGHFDYADEDVLLHERA